MVGTDLANPLSEGNVLWNRDKNNKGKEKEKVLKERRCAMFLRG
jgi:hypothetical protein